MIEELRLIIQGFYKKYNQTHYQKKERWLGPVILSEREFIVHVINSEGAYASSSCDYPN